MAKFNVDVQLTGQNGNAFNLMGIVSKAMRSAGASHSEVKSFCRQAMSSDYDHLLNVCANWVNVL